MINNSNFTNYFDVVTDALCGSSNKKGIEIDAAKCLMLAIIRAEKSCCDGCVVLYKHEIAEVLGYDEEEDLTSFEYEDIFKVILNCSLTDVDEGGVVSRTALVNKYRYCEDWVEINLNMDCFGSFDELDEEYIEVLKRDIQMLVSPRGIRALNYFRRKALEREDCDEVFSIEDLVEILKLNKYDYFYEFGEDNTVYINYAKFEEEVLKPINEEIMYANTVLFNDVNNCIFVKNVVFDTLKGRYEVVYEVKYTVCMELDPDEFNMDF
ncbi:MAG: hypothetical protein K6F77_10585 [Lachnospiraceae bacterium]|nr:hypothetical protein [Lachnospiraceae bacterium]